MGQHQHPAVPAKGTLHAGRIVPHGRAFKLEIMMLPRNPVGAVRFGGLAGFALLHLLKFAELAYQVAVKVQQGNSVAVLKARAQAGVQGGQQIAAGIHLVREPLSAFLIPLMHKIAVAIDQLGGTARAPFVGENDIAVPAFGRVIAQGSHRMYGRLGLSRACTQADDA